MSTQLEIGALILLSAALIGVGIYVVRRRRSTPEQRERKRRLLVHQTGRLGDAEITEVAENTLFYSYLARGVQYTASQDIGTLRDRLPAKLEFLIGPAGLKYIVNNPANSILICEEWSGCRLAASPGESSITDSSLDVNAVRHQPKDTALT